MRTPSRFCLGVIPGPPTTPALPSRPTHSAEARRPAVAQTLDLTSPRRPRTAAKPPPRKAASWMQESNPRESTSLIRTTSSVSWAYRRGRRQGPWLGS